MRGTRSAVLSRSGVVLAAVVALLTAFAVPASAATAVRYVALGDSYASGVGAGGETGSCLRSTHAYPALWAAAHAPASFTFAACSGATTSTVINSQLGALDSSTTLVSVTVGGNDVGFSSIMSTCVLDGTAQCVAAVSAAEGQAQSVLPGRLDATYGQIRSRAPSARVVVTDYPVFYDLSVWWCLGLSSTSRSKIDEGIGILDGVLSAAAARSGFSFADVRGNFGRHEICDSSSWLHSLNILDLTESYHPTANGQQYGYLPAFSTKAG